MLIMNNIVRYTVLNKATDFLLFIGKAVITAGMGEFDILFTNFIVPVRK